MKTKENSSRIKIAEDPIKARRMMGQAESLAKDANRLAGLYSELQIGPFSMELLEDVYRTGGAEVRRRYIEAARDDAAKIRSIAIRRQIERDAEQWDTPFAQYVKRLEDTGTARSLMRFLILGEDGRFRLSEDTAERLAEMATIYLDDPEQIEKYHQHLAAVDALNILFEDGKCTPPLWYALFQIGEDGRFQLPDGCANYAYLVERRKQKEDAGEISAPPASSEPQEKPEPEQRIKTLPTAPRMVKRIVKPFDSVDRGTELRRGITKVSPDSPDW